MEKDYSNREIDAKFETVLAKLDSNHQLQMAELQHIREQTTKTNGRVTENERCIANLKRDVAVTATKISVSVAVVGFVVGLAVKILV